MNKPLSIIIFCYSLFGILNIHSQNYLGFEMDAIYGDFYYPVTHDYSPGIEAGIVFQRNGFLNNERLVLHSGLTALKRTNNSGAGDLLQVLPKLGLGYQFGNQKVCFEAVGGLYSKFLVQYDSFYHYGNSVDSKFFTIGAFVRPQVNIQINDRVALSIFGSARFDISATYVYWLSTPFNMRKYSLLSGVQILFKLKN